MFCVIKFTLAKLFFCLSTEFFYFHRGERYDWYGHFASGFNGFGKLVPEIGGLKVDKVGAKSSMRQKPGSGGSGPDFEVDLHWVSIETVSIFIEKIPISTLSTLRSIFSATRILNLIKPGAK